MAKVIPLPVGYTLDTKADKCPECGGKSDPEHVNCFHCLECDYVECIEEI